MITVAIPTYKRRRQLWRALRSVLDQTIPADHILVADDADDAEVERICFGFKDRRIKYVARRPRLGLVENWNSVLYSAKDGLVALLEDDNFWIPNHLENAARMLREFPNAALYHSGHEEARDRDGQLETYKRQEPPWCTATGRIGGLVPTKAVIFDALKCGSINASTIVLRRGNLDQVPPFDRRYPMGMDTLMWARLAMLFPCVYSPAIEVVYTYDGSNASTYEISTRRAGPQFRSTRAMIVSEALARGAVSIGEIEEHIDRSTDANAAALVAVLASCGDENLVSIAKAHWQKRRWGQHANGFVRASQVVGFGLLRHANLVDGLLSLLLSVTHGFKRALWHADSNKKSLDFAG